MKRVGILAVNGGSSSLKCALFEMGSGEPRLAVRLRVSDIDNNPRFHVTIPGGRLLADEPLDRTGNVAANVACLQQILDWLDGRDDMPGIDAVGHRVVHGGDRFTNPQVVTGKVVRELHELSALAPLHQPASLRLIEACGKRLPGIPQVASFDTAFHRHMPEVARTYALPRALTESGVRAYGFHGISFEYVWNALLQLDGRARDKRTVIAHLGAGASLCAIRHGRSIATTMGFSTAEGVPMATRCGSIDPGIPIYLMREHGMGAEELENMLYRNSGMLALSGISGNMRKLRESDDPAARAAVEFFVYRVVREIASLAGALGGLEVLVFTGGIGANDAALRDDVVKGVAWLGAGVHAIATDEELQIARHTADVLSLY